MDYGLTIKCIKKNYNASEQEVLETALECISKHKALLCCHTFELDSVGRVHLHGHFVARKGIRLNLFKKSYWHIHIDPLRTKEDKENWTSYMYKDQGKDDRLMEKLVYQQYQEQPYQFVSSG